VKHQYKIHTRKERDRRARIAATDAAKNFGRLVDRVREEGATYVIERGGKPVAQIGPVEPRVTTVADFVEFVRHLPPADEEYLQAVEEAVAMFNEPRVPENPWER
jgi:antitoxin (DNA-binding transcriptional repressor) of toxin-antitoxin stability system